jgi:hypothetical protein
MDGLLDPTVGPLDWALNTWRPGVDALHDSNAKLLAILALGLVLVWLGRKRQVQSPHARGELELPTVGRHAWWGLFARHERRATVGGAHFDIARRHVGILDTSDSSKSTLLALLVQQIDQTYAGLTADRSPALLNLTRARGGLVWEPRGKLGWYAWGGPLELAVQRVEHFLPATGADTAEHRAVFRDAAHFAWADVDEHARDVRQIMAVLPQLVSEQWNTRLQQLVASLGTSLRTAAEGGIDLSEELDRGRDVVFALDGCADAAVRQRLARIVVLEMLRAADRVGNLSAVIDEVGLLGADLFTESARRLRARMCTGLFASHVASDFPSSITGLINVWFIGQISGSDKQSRMWASDTTFGRVPAEHFGEHTLPLCTFWLVANGRIQRVKVPTWRMQRRSVRLAEIGVNDRRVGVADDVTGDPAHAS